MIRRLLAVGAVASVLSVPSVALASVDYSGTWILDPSKSAIPAPKRAKKDGGATASGLTLVVRQSGSELTVSRRAAAAKRGRSHELTFKLDGTESVNQPPRKGGEIRSKASWRDSKLVIEATEKASTKKGDVERKSVEEWALSEDGKVLTIKTTRTGRKRDRTVTQVFNKQ